MAWPSGVAQQPASIHWLPTSPHYSQTPCEGMLGHGLRTRRRSMWFSDAVCCGGSDRYSMWSKIEVGLHLPRDVSSVVLETEITIWSWSDDIVRLPKYVTPTTPIYQLSVNMLARLSFLDFINMEAAFFSFSVSFEFQNDPKHFNLLKDIYIFIYMYNCFSTANAYWIESPLRNEIWYVDMKHIYDQKYIFQYEDPRGDLKGVSVCAPGIWPTFTSSERLTLDIVGSLVQGLIRGSFTSPPSNKTGRFNFICQIL